MATVKKYVIRKNDIQNNLIMILNSKLPSQLKEEFQNMFSDDDIAWRLHYKDNTPQKFLYSLGIDYDNPTFRDAVAFDLIKLDDDSVSNDSDYTYWEHLSYSQFEYERFLLHKNYRVNLAHTDYEWSSIKYGEDEEDEDDGILKRTIWKMWLGMRLSDNLLGFFKGILDNGEDSLYPVTNGNDFYGEVALIPNTEANFRQISSRSYYDDDYIKYRNLLKNKYGIDCISTFALVNPKKDKNHTGEFLVKIQRKLNDTDFLYIQTKLDYKGQIKGDIRRWISKKNEIIGVCEEDFGESRTEQAEEYEDVTVEECDIPMVKSTTSSHYSVFMQRIPDYDLRLVRHYLQFKNRLEGMELCLEQLKRDREKKEVRASYCFAKLTMIISRLMKEFVHNKDILDLVGKFLDLQSEWDNCILTKAQVKNVIQEKKSLLEHLQLDYSNLPNSKLDQKISLGQKIRSLKLELDKNLYSSIEQLDKRRIEIEKEMNAINEKILEIMANWNREYKIDVADAERIEEELNSEKISEVQRKIEEQINKYKEQFIVDSSSSSFLLLADDSISSTYDDESNIGKTISSSSISQDDEDDVPPALVAIDVKKLNLLILQSERWRNYAYSMAYEMVQYDKMYKKCSDATIRVRRLVHNFEERIRKTQEDVWEDDSYMIKPDFDFKNIQVASLSDIILLHDWWACNAGNVKGEDIGMTDEEFMEFRKRCNKISYNLRKNQYAQILAVQLDRSQKRIDEITSLLEDKDTIHWDDKYGKPDDEDEDDSWDITKVKNAAKIRLFSMADSIINQQDDSESRNAVLLSSSSNDKKDDRISIGNLIRNAQKKLNDKEKEERLYREDSKRLIERTTKYLKDIGVISNVKDLEKLALRNAIMNSDKSRQPIFESIEQLKQKKANLDSKQEQLNKQRNALQSIIQSIDKIEKQVKELIDRNNSITSYCVKQNSKKKNLSSVEKNIRNRMLLEKIENETKIQELKSLAKNVKRKNLKDFNILDSMKNDVNSVQKEYNKSISDFQNEFFNQDGMKNLMIAIYNKYQDDIIREDD